MMDDYDLPKISVWQHDESKLQLSEMRMLDTCTFCPYAEVWKELDGLDVGYIYDYEFHLTIYQAYLPGTLVEFDGVQTKGDPVCNFRFTSPEPAHA